MIKKQINLNYFDEHIASLIFKSLSKTTRAFVGARKAGMTSGIAHQTRFETPTSIGFTPLIMFLAHRLHINQINLSTRTEVL